MHFLASVFKLLSLYFYQYIVEMCKGILKLIVLKAIFIDRVCHLNDTKTLLIDIETKCDNRTRAREISKRISYEKNIIKL